MGSDNSGSSKKALKFNLDRSVGLSIYEQIRGQLLSAIYCGKIQAGDKLPSMRELADSLEVNYKTIRRVYQHLSEEDLIEIAHGSGAFLRPPTGQETYEDMRRRAIFKLLSEVTDRARQLGLAPRRFLQLLDGYLSGHNLRPLKLAVVDHEEEAFIFSRELEARLNVHAEAIPLAKQLVAEHEESLQECDYLLTTSWHLDEVKGLSEMYSKKIVELKPSHQIYTEILAAAQDQNVGIVVRDEQTLHASWDIFMNIYHPTTEKKFWIAPIDREEVIERILAEADLIFVSPMCWDEMRKRTPAERELKTYENYISEETINQLKELQLLD